MEGTPPSTWISKTAWAPLPSGFPSSKTPPPPVWICTKLLDTVILLKLTYMIFLLDQFQFSVNSAFVGHVKIPFSRLLKQAYTVCK